MHGHHWGKNRWQIEKKKTTKKKRVNEGRKNKETHEHTQTAPEYNMIKDNLVNKIIPIPT